MSPKTLLLVAALHLLVSLDSLLATTVTVYDRKTSNPVVGATIYIETDGDYRVSVRDGETKEGGVYNAETGGSLLAKCEERVAEDGVKVTCRVLVITAEKDGKSDEATIRWTGKSWDPPNLTLSIAMQTRCPGEFTMVRPRASREKLFLRLIPLYVVEPFYSYSCSCDPSAERQPRLMYSRRLVGVQAEWVPASQVPPGSQQSPTIPAWAAPFIDQRHMFCRPERPAPACACPYPSPPRELVFPGPIVPRE